MKAGDRIIGHNLIGQRCDFKGCQEEAQRIVRFKPTGDVVTARCKAHQGPTWEWYLSNGHCPKCSVDVVHHFDESENVWRGCDFAIDYLVNLAEQRAES